jgi:hypothetical protein
MLISIRAIPQRSFRPNVTWQGKDLLTPSLLRIACMACDWIVFRVLVSSVVTGSEYIIEGTYIPQRKINVSILLNLEVERCKAYVLALNYDVAMMAGRHTSAEWYLFRGCNVLVVTTFRTGLLLFPLLFIDITRTW